MDKVRFGVIGVGNMGSKHLQNISDIPRAELAALCDIDKDKADKYADEYDVKGYYNASEMIGAGNLDAVLIATPHYDHTPLAISAFENGLHVLTEKPVAVHKADAEKMIDSHKKHSKLKFGAMFQQRTIPAHIKLKQLIDSGEFGEVLRVNWIITTWFRSQAYYDSGGWRATWAGEGGGVLLNQCPHQLDLFQWFFGMPVNIRAFCSIGKYHNIEVEDDVTAYCEYENGATGVFITSTGEAPGTNRLEITADRGRIVFAESGGSIHFVRNEKPVTEFCVETKQGFGKPDCWDISIPVGNDSGGHHRKVIENFTQSILDGTELIAPAEEGIHSVELANSMLFSSIKGQVIDLPMDSSAFESELKKLIESSTFEKKTIETEADDFAKSFE